MSNDNLYQDKKTHRAVITVDFSTSIKENDPDAIADEIVRDIMRCGIPANLEEIEIVESPARTTYSFPSFKINELEGGHGDDYKAIFSIRHEHGDFCVESVDVQMIKDHECGVVPIISNIGGVGGEVMMKCQPRADGRDDLESMCRAWLGMWGRAHIGKCEDSVHGMFLIIKQIVSEGTFIDEGSFKNSDA